ncbi:MAG: DUF374 domain-containing protein [bacterium]|nr:DUF374 domain-containing protein [bacterium]
MRQILVRIVARIYFVGLSALYKSARLRVFGAEHLEGLWGRGETAIVCFFHGDYLLLFPHFKGREACIFTTESRRGNYLSQIISLFRYRPCKIPDRRGSQVALERMIAEVSRGYNAVLAVDGPLGPYHKVKHGALVLALKTGKPIVPVATASVWKVVSRKRWDRYTVPLPFTRAVILVGEPIAVPEAADPDRLEELRQQLEDRLEALNSQAEGLLNRQSFDPGV